jgi:hypothetical protein
MRRHAVADDQQEGSLPPDPMTQLAQGAAQGHELFMAYVNAGFARAEALQILIAIFVAGIAKGPSSGSPQ